MSKRPDRVVDATLPVRSPPHAVPDGLARLIERYVPSFYLDVGSACGLRCAYCCVPRGEHDDEVRTERAEVLLDAIDSATRVGLHKVALLGGEPTIRRDFFDLLRRARERGLREVILTTKSGRLREPSYVAELIAHGVSIVHLSLDTFDPETLGALIGTRADADALLAGLDVLLAHRAVDTFLYAVLANPNLGQLCDYVRAVAARQDRFGVRVPVVLAGLKLHARADRNHAALLPTVARAAEAAVEAIELGASLGVPIATRHLQPCLLGAREPHALEAYVRDARVDLDTGAELPPERSSHQVKVAACDGCVHGGWCDGVSRRYLSIVGQGEFGARG